MKIQVEKMVKGVKKEIVHEDKGRKVPLMRPVSLFKGTSLSTCRKTGFPC